MSVKIGFHDDRTWRLFNDHVRLEARYGSDVADKIASRMALLSIAPNLAKLPARPPIRFRRDARMSGQFLLDIGAEHSLRFSGVGERAKSRKATALETIEEIEVIGIEHV